MKNCPSPGLICSRNNMCISHEHSNICHQSSCKTRVNLEDIWTPSDSSYDLSDLEWYPCMHYSCTSARTTRMSGESISRVPQIKSCSFRNFSHPSLTLTPCDIDNAHPNPMRGHDWAWWRVDEGASCRHAGEWHLTSDIWHLTSDAWHRVDIE